MDELSLFEADSEVNLAGQVVADVAGFGPVIVPPPIADAGEAAARAWVEFFAPSIRNTHTREAYLRNASEFLRWCDGLGLELKAVESWHVASYVEAMMHRGDAEASVKQRLASLRVLFDWLVTRQVVAANPASHVRGPKLKRNKGATPVLDEDRRFLDSIDVSHVVGLRDRALCALVTYALPRVSAACGMDVGDYYMNGKVGYRRSTITQ